MFLLLRKLGWGIIGWKRIKLLNPMKIVSLKFFLLIVFGFIRLDKGYSQKVDTLNTSNNEIEEIILYQKNLNDEYRDSETSPLDSSDLQRFSSLNFYSPNLEYKVVARFVKSKNAKKFKMKTSTDRTPEYIKYGEVQFVLMGKRCLLSVYQNVELSKKIGFEKYLFLPFTDLTNGETTYGGGRYLDLIIPDRKTIILNFNLAYNPYCAYSHGYSCPIPPQENFLELHVEAGARDGLIYK